MLPRRAALAISTRHTCSAACQLFVLHTSTHCAIGADRNVLPFHCARCVFIVYSYGTIVCVIYLLRLYTVRGCDRRRRYAVTAARGQSTECALDDLR